MNPINLPRYLALARQVSLTSTYKIRVGAVIVQHGTPIALGCNVQRTHPKWVRAKQTTIHAEIAALISTQSKLTGASIFVYREHKNGLPALARPCENCLAVLQHYGIKWIYYSTTEYPYWSCERL